MVDSDVPGPVGAGLGLQVLFGPLDDRVLQFQREAAGGAFGVFGCRSARGGAGCDRRHVPHRRGGFPGGAARGASQARRAGALDAEEAVADRAVLEDVGTDAEKADNPDLDPFESTAAKAQDAGAAVRIILDFDIAEAVTRLGQRDRVAAKGGGEPRHRATRVSVDLDVGGTGRGGDGRKQCVRSPADDHLVAGFGPADGFEDRAGFRLGAFGPGPGRRRIALTAPGGRGECQEDDAHDPPNPDAHWHRVPPGYLTVLKLAVFDTEPVLPTSL